MKILICDDTVQPLTGLKPKLAALVSNSEIDVVTGQNVVAVAEDLERRRKAAQNGSNDAVPWGSHQFDEIDVLVVDYNFVQLAHAGGLTGHRLAYLARCYSDAGYIVVLNQFGENRFDLTLRDHPETYADLHLGLRQITNEGLWNRSDWPAFRPWNWPVIPDARARLGRLRSQVADALDAKVLDHLQLGDRVGALPRSVRQFLSDDDITFRDFVLKSGQGFDLTDKPFGDDVLPGLASSRISKWLEHMVFAAQDLLIDAPRLTSRYPSLLEGGDLASLTGVPLTPAWQDSMEWKQPAEDHRYGPSDWLSKAAWWRPALLGDERIVENEEVTSPDTDLRFAEDSSRFLPKAEVTSFVADLASPFVQRFVRRERDDAVDYQPELRFSL